LDVPAARPPTAGAPAAAASPAAAAGTPATATAGADASPYINLFEAGAAQAQSARPGTGAGAAADPAAAASLQALQNSPQFNQIRQLVQAQPHLLQPLLQQLGASNPQLLQLIQQNQDAFLQMLMDPNANAEGLFGDDDDDMGDEEGGLPPGAQVLQLTPEENEAINRLCALGFSRQAAAEAFFACDKNEELAANFLFESGNGDW
ncbi:hypothetical protein HDV05_003183, partial [Chytridiales sp. JEL 0842]